MSNEESQIQKRARLDAEVIEDTYTALGDSVQAQSRDTANFEHGVDKVDAAACICLDYLGVTPGTVPDDVDDPEERLECLCRPSGTMRRQVTLDEGWQRIAFGAMLGSLDTGEAVALVPSKTGAYEAIDAGGNAQAVTPEFAEHIDESATLFYRPFPNKSLAAIDLIRYLFEGTEFSDRMRIRVAAVVATLVGLIPTWANMLVFSTIVPSESLKYVAAVACLLVGVTVSKVLMDTLRSFVVKRLTTKLNLMSEAAIFARVLMLPPSFFKDYESGNLATRVSQMSSLTQLLLSLVFDTGLTGLLSFVYIFQIWAFAPSLAVPAFVTVVALIAITIISAFATKRYEGMAQLAYTELSGTVTSLLNGVSKIKLAGAENRAFARWAKDYVPYAKANFNKPISVKAASALSTLVSALGMAIIYFAAGSSGVSMADYMSFCVAYGMMLSAVSSMSSIGSQLAQIGPMFDLLEPILSCEPEVGEDKPMVGKLDGSIEVSEISFRYGEGSTYVLDDLSFDVQESEYVAIVGKSGCGKSTLIRLLLGFESPERGSIFYGPYDVSKVDLRSLRRSIGTVMQDGKLLSGTIESNITISTPQATEDDAWEAAEIAGVADDIREMPMGMQTNLSEDGGGISGGQRQRIMIARAVCGNRKILIFDEATSALDNVTQQQVTESLSNLGCTRIVVAHRLSTVKHCDRILVLNDGHIAEEGSYDELMACDGLFADLVRRQQLED